MNLGELKELLEIIAEQNITEFELEEKGVKLRVKKGGSGAIAVDHAIVPVTEAVPAAPAHATAPTDDIALDGLAIVNAPMVGTFYRQSEPGSEPFAGKGRQVKKGQILCIIEAMKLMNEIESDLSGEIVEIFVEDGQSVQFGDKLFAIREI